MGIESRMAHAGRARAKRVNASTAERPLQERDFVEIKSNDLKRDGGLTPAALKRAKSDALTLKPGKLLRALIDSSDCYGIHLDIFDIAESALRDERNEAVLRENPEIEEYLQVVVRMIELPIEYEIAEDDEEMAELRSRRADLEVALTDLIYTSDGDILSTRLTRDPAKKY